MYEREDELAAIGAAIAGARSGCGRTLLLEGPAGIGKTALLDAARSGAARAGFLVLAATGAELEQDLEFAVARQLFPDSLPALAARTPHAVLHGLYSQALELATDRPVLVAVDDAHLADAPSLRWIGYLMRRIEHAPVLVVLAGRAVEPAAESSVFDRIGAGAPVDVLRPSPLGPSGVRDAIADRLGTNASPAFARACHAVTGGVPFLLSELCAWLRTAGVEPDDAGAGRVAAAAPAGIARAVRTRLLPLGPPALAVAEAAAVLAADARLDRVAALADVPIESAAELVDRLTAMGMLIPGDPVAFRDAIVRNALHDHMPAQRRGLAHVAAAERLLADGEPRERAAAHLLAAPAGRREWIVCTLRDAAATAAARGAPELSAALLRRALLDCSPNCGEILLELAMAELTTRDPAALAHARRAMSEAATPLVRARAALVAAEALTSTGRYGEAGEALVVVERDSAGLDAATRSALRWDALALSTVQHGVSSASGPLTELDAGALSGTRPGERLPLALQSLERCCEGDGSEQVLRPARRVLVHGDPRAPRDARALLIAARSLCLADRLDEARQCSTELVDAAGERGALATVTTARALRAEACQRAGDLTGAAADAGDALASAAEHGLVMELAAAIQLGTELALERAPADAGSLLARFGSRAFPCGYPESTVLFARGRVAAAAGDLSAAAELLAASGRARLAWGEHNPAACPWRSELALVHALRGDRCEAERLAAEEVRLARRFGAKRALGIALRAQALVRAGRARRAGLQAAAEVLAASPARLEHARVLADLGAEQRRSGSRRLARETLARALDLAHACGARVLTERCRAELLIAGARPRRERISGPDSLTAGERRVAELAADGLTNRGIAQALFLTTKTVETHLSHAYMKLDISGRAELTGAMHAEAA